MRKMRTVALWGRRRPLQRRYRSGFAPDSLFSPSRGKGHSFVFWAFAQILKKNQGAIWVIRRGLPSPQ